MSNIQTKLFNNFINEIDNEYRKTFKYIPENVIY